MLNKIRQYHKDYPDREAFFSIIGMHFPEGGADYRLIEDAYELGKEAFRGIYREGNGERYFEHLRRVALMILLHLRVIDAEIIAASLLHDLVEDIDYWTHQKVSIRFSSRTGELVWWVSKPPKSNFDDNKEKRNHFFHHRLAEAPREPLIIKLPDRLDNNMNMWGLDTEKQIRKVEETKNFYLPLAEKHIILIHEMEDALKENEERFL